MLPSVLSRQIETGISDFLRTTFPVTTPFFHGIIDRLIEQDQFLFKGPFLSIKLPFRTGQSGKTYFSGFDPGFTPHLHQEKAFERLTGNTPQSTIVATGTGSGKTESFLLPILEYCYRLRGTEGIKAIIVYPMNALANDQAKRLAKLIHGNENLRGNVTAGLFVGESDKNPVKGMLPSKLITDKNTMRKNPPDILLTNYKMLDYLLIRPGDFPLWQQNAPDTLKYLVVDELHTFDGAQGTDLACLIRRIKARLKTPENHLCCIGTSATLGGKDSINLLLDYAGEIFGEPFTPDAVITESRISLEEFLVNSEINPDFGLPNVNSEMLSGSTYLTIDDYIKAQYAAWFNSQASDVSSEEWLAQLAEQIKTHHFFCHLMLILNNKTIALPDLIQKLDTAVPGFGDLADAHKTALLESFLSLVSTARHRSGDRLLPFLDVRVQMWLRELRRLVGEVKHTPHIRFSDDLSEAQLEQHLPLVHCRDCGAMGWGATRREQDFFLNNDLNSFYQNFFRQNSTLVFVFPVEEAENELLKTFLCGKCLQLTDRNNTNKCTNCNANNSLIAVQLVHEKQRINNVLKTSRDCPHCGANNGLTIVGSRAASLLSVAINQLFSSPFNDDKKLLTFSDSVQDASHRAGFFTGRTYRFSFRSALQQFVMQQNDSIQLDEAPDKFIRYWQGKWDENKFIATFIPPDMMWYEDFEILRESGKLPKPSDLPRELKKRISWEIFAEYGYNARIGRTLEKTGASVIFPRHSLIDNALDIALPALQNEIGDLRELNRDLLERFIRGLILQIKNKGGIDHFALKSFVENWGQTYVINKKLTYMPHFSNIGRAPVFITNKPGVRRFENIVSRDPNQRTWLNQWVVKNFDTLSPTVVNYITDIYKTLLNALVEAAIIQRHDHQNYSVWGIRPDALLITTSVAQMSCNHCSHGISVSDEEAAKLESTHCLRYNCAGRYQLESTKEDYYRKLYETGDIERIFANEHTGLLRRDDRETLEANFQERYYPWNPNLLSCTPTLEMGVNIGDLSSLILCSVPPAQANYLQRIGRAGRKDGNALNLTVANGGRPHDLYFNDNPLEMIDGDVTPPGCFLDAPAVLARQFLAFCFDRWVESGVGINEIPRKVGAVLNNLNRKDDTQRFPFNLLTFIETQQTVMLNRFQSIFRNSISKEAKELLEALILGSGIENAGIRYHILMNLESLDKERIELKKRIKKVEIRINELQNSPAKDQNFQTDLSNLLREKSALKDIVSKIESKDTYNFFTDEGLLPNYAFPESGVLLRSIIYRKKKVADANGKYDTRIYEYERPAATAIRELAPANRFYAEGRRVTIDQIDPKISPIEEWRFCNNCSFIAKEATNDNARSCPNCGSPGWGDQGQVRKMIRMKQVIATTSERDSRSWDDSDEREPEFYNKELMADIDEQNIQSAYKIDDDALPFGFEFVNKVNLREINFGLSESTGETLTIAGKPVSKNGFEICGECGKVQMHGKAPEHAIHCGYFKSQSAAMMTTCLYLYREFSSEAFRILIPELSLTESTVAHHSFMSALFLGLRKHFKGKIDHLGIALQREPVPDTPYFREYVILYDRVPGGTGYLKELLRQELPLIDIFEAALRSLESCPNCQQDAGKEGCYSCIYAFRFNYEMANISRNKAIELLTKILNRKDKFIKINSVNYITVNPLVESQLEFRFLEAIEKLVKQRESKQIQRDVYEGKSGYSFSIGEYRYYLIPQVELNEKDNVATPSRADFIIYPDEKMLCKPIAIFTDGYTFHAKEGAEIYRVGKDMAQRMAILKSNNFHVWSLTWNDVEWAFTQRESNFENYLITHTGQINSGLSIFPNFDNTRFLNLQHKGNLEILFKFLEFPKEDQWQIYAAMQWALKVKSNPKTFDESSLNIITQHFFQEDSTAIKTALEKTPENPDGYFAAMYSVINANGSMGEVWQLAYANKNAIRDKDIQGFIYAIRLNDIEDVISNNNFKAVWNGYLRLLNIMQYLPNCHFFTTQGIK